MQTVRDSLAAGRDSEKRARARARVDGFESLKRARGQAVLKVSLRYSADWKTYSKASAAKIFV